jgi:hypothetical protein
MPPSSLTEDEFRLLAYVRAYSDNREQSLDPTWVQEQLEFSLDRLRSAALGLASRGLAEFLEFEPPENFLQAHPEISAGQIPCAVQLTKFGWDYLRQGREV